MHLAYLPTLIVWAISWVLGPGVALGEGSLALAGGTEAGPLPTVPLFGLIPDNLSPFMWAIVALPVLVAALVTLFARMRSRRDDQPLQRLITPMAGAFLAALTLALLAHLSRGALGPGRLIDFGPHPGWMLLAALGVFAVGGAIGAFLPLNTFVIDLEPVASGEAEDASSRAETERSSQTRGTFLDDDFDVDADFDNTTDLDEVRRRLRGESAAAAPAASTAIEKRDERKPAVKERETPASREMPKREEREVPTKKAAPRTSSKPDLADVLRRPDEPDIYADIDDDF